MEGRYIKRCLKSKKIKKKVKVRKNFLVAGVDTSVTIEADNDTLPKRNHNHQHYIAVNLLKSNVCFCFWRKCLKGHPYN